MTKRQFGLAVAILVVTLLASSGKAHVKFGVLAQRASEITLKEWDCLGNYLSERVGQEEPLFLSNLPKSSISAVTNPRASSSPIPGLS